MPGWFPTAIALLPALLYAQDTQQEQLSANRAKWDALRIASYSFTLWLEGQWNPGPPIRLLVKDGKLVSAHVLQYSFVRKGAEAELEVREGAEADAQGLPSTVPELFRLAAESLAEPDSRARVYFHSEFGLPLRIELNQLGNPDGIGGYFVSDFVALE